MKVRLWGPWYVSKVYWNRVVGVAAVSLAVGFLAGYATAQGDKKVLAVPEPVPAQTLVSFDSDIPLGLISSRNQGVMLCAPDGSNALLVAANPYDTLSLPNGDMVLCERYKNQVVKVDADGTVVLTIPASGPVDAEMAADGTLIVVQNGSQEVVGYDGVTGEVRWRVGGFRNHYDVTLSADGSMFVADSGNGRVVKLGPDRNAVATYDDLGFPNTVETLPNGNLQVTTYHGGEILELDQDGQLVGKVGISGTVFRAIRLADGDTLAFEGERSDGQGRLHRIAPDGSVRDIQATPVGVDFEPIR